MIAFMSLGEKFWLIVADMIKKILNTPSFRGEVKPSVPCRFAACKRSLNLLGSRNLGKITDNFSPTIPPFAARISRVIADVQAPGSKSGNI